jgi:hypothetical protein
MININEYQLSKRLGKINIKVGWSKGRRGTSHYSSRIILRGIQLKMNLECQKHWEKGQGRYPLNVGVVREITCTNYWLWSLIIFLIYRSFTFIRVYTP